MSRKFFQLFTFLLTMMAITAAFAVRVQNLNTAIVPVPDRSQAVFEKVLPQAMQQTLVKLSGNVDIAQIAEIQQTLPFAQRYVQSYHYSMSPQLDGTHQLSLEIHFDQHALVELLNTSHQWVWPANRQQTLLWLRVDDQSTQLPQIVASGDANATTQAIQQVTQLLGVPMLFPAMDLQDQNYLNDNAKMPFDSDKLAQAAARYHVSSVLAGNLSTAVDGSWQAQWMYLLDGKPYQWNTVGKTEDDVIQQSMANLSHIIVTQLAMHNDPQAQQPVIVQVLGIENLDDYAVVLSDLRQLTDVSGLSVEEMQGSTLTLRLRVVGGVKRLTTALEHNADITKIPAVMTQGERGADLYYQFKPSAGA